MREEAMAAGNKALSIINISVDALTGFYREWDMAMILMMIREYDDSITKLEFLLQQNGYISVELLKIDPFWIDLKTRICVCLFSRLAVWVKPLQSLKNL